MEKYTAYVSIQILNATTLRLYPHGPTHILEVRNADHEYKFHYHWNLTFPSKYNQFLRKSDNGTDNVEVELNDGLFDLIWPEERFPISDINRLAEENNYTCASCKRVLPHTDYLVARHNKLLCIICKGLLNLRGMEWDVKLRGMSMVTV